MGKKNPKLRKHFYSRKYILVVNGLNVNVYFLLYRCRDTNLRGKKLDIHSAFSYPAELGAMLNS